MSDYDAVVVGAGPAGSSTAYLLAKAGARVLLLDRAHFPRVKPCGGGITGRAFMEAPVDLAPVVEATVNKVRFSFRQGQEFEHQSSRPLVHMTQRKTLDAYLAERAVEAGAEFKDNCALVSVAFADGAVSISTADGDLVSRVLVGANGANGQVAKQLGLRPVSDRQVALEANFPYSPAASRSGWEDALAFDLGAVPGGYGWSFPKGDHFNVGCGGWHREGHRLRSHLQVVRSHYELTDAEMLNLQGHHLPLRDDRAPISLGPALLVGDAAGLIDPMSGEGIFAAFVSARLAAASIDRFLAGETNAFRQYEADVEAELMGDIRAARVLRDAYDYLPGTSYFALRHSRLFRDMLCRLMTGEGSYEAFVRRLGPASAILRWLARRGELARASA